MNRLDLSTKSILFIGYGAVAKCTWNHFDRYFLYDPQRVFAVDQFAEAFTGPNVHLLHKKVRKVNEETFDLLISEIGMKEGDVIIDLSYDSCTYFFIRRCLELGIHYMNTSIEDKSDDMKGTSIDVQQKRVSQIVSEYALQFPFRSNVLTEQGQNPGMVEHYFFHALREMNHLRHPNQPPTYDRSTLLQTMKDYQVGSVLFSEIDDQVIENPSPLTVLTNTWSVSGFLSEALDQTELVRGRNNSWIKPVITEDMLDCDQSVAYANHKSSSYDVLFLKEKGINAILPSICPLWTPNGIEFVSFHGKLIHHGEMFELARLIGEDAPFMTYVYANNLVMDRTIQHFFNIHPNAGTEEIIAYANHPDHFRVVDLGKGLVAGQDSIGATFFCGKDKVERIFWCGSLFRDQDDHHPYFTPTTVQVAAGVLSGLSYILEEKHACRGWFQSSDLDTEYILEKARPLLGCFFFTEIPVSLFTEPLVILTNPVVSIE